MSLGGNRATEAISKFLKIYEIIPPSREAFAVTTSFSRNNRKSAESRLE